MPDAPPATGLSQASAAVAAGQVRRHVALLVAACLLLFLTGAASLPLTDPEEARCALIVREMIRSGDWLMPQLLGQPYFDKPAPFFWLAAAGEMLTGNAALGGRMIAALAGVLAVLITYALGRRIFGPAAGLIGGLALATSVQFWYMARWYRMDMPFAAAMWAAVAWFWLCERPRDDAARAPRWVSWCGFHLFCALAVLFKGPAGVVLPVLVVGCHFVLGRQARRIAELLHPGGLAVFAGIAVPWYAAVSLREPSYAYEFLFEQNVMRFASGTFGHTWPGILFVPILLLGLMPWTFHLAPALLRRRAPRPWRSPAEGGATQLLWLAALIPLVFFAFSETKLVGYVLPCFPPLAVRVGGVIAEWIDGDGDDRAVRFAAYGLVAAVAVLWAAAAALEVGLGSAGSWIGVAVAACSATTAMMLLSLARRRRAAFVAWAVVGSAGLLTFVSAHTTREGYERLSTRTLASSVPRAHLGDSFLVWPKMRYSFAYYLDVPAGHLRHVGSEGIDSVAASLNGAGGVYVLVSGERNLRELSARCPGRVGVVGRIGDVWLVSNHIVHRQKDQAPEGA